jgi:hypothetical protein
MSCSFVFVDFLLMELRKFRPVSGIAKLFRYCEVINRLISEIGPFLSQLP